MPTPNPESNALVIVHYSDDNAETHALASALSTQLNIPVQSAFLDSAAPSVGEAIQISVTEHRPDHVIVLPFFMGTSAVKTHNIKMIVDAARDRWAGSAVIYGDSIHQHPGVIAAYRDILREMEPPSQDNALLVAGRGSRNATGHAQLHDAARLLRESYPCGALEVAFHGQSQADMAGGFERLVKNRNRRIILLPYVLYERGLYQSIRSRAESWQAQHPNVEIRVPAPLPQHPGVLEAIGQRYQEALAALRAQIASGEYARLRALSHSHGGLAHTHRVPDFTSDLQGILPPRYQNGAEVSAAPMEAADLIFDENGQVAWDQIWGSFCDLALAGGPPHRGTLLEPVWPEAVRENPEGYQQVLAELERGIRLVTNLPVVTSRSPGWIGLQCADETMALWLLRAIIVENISVRREGAVLYLPAGPDFRLEHEIKNVITVVAKTHHYWTEHLNNLP